MLGFCLTSRTPLFSNVLQVNPLESQKQMFFGMGLKRDDVLGSSFGSSWASRIPGSYRIKAFGLMALAKGCDLRTVSKE